MDSSGTDYIHAQFPEPHIARTKEILNKHPEIRQLFGTNPFTALWTFGIVALHFAVAMFLQSSPWWTVVLSAWTIGAVCEHALFVVIHDCAHNLAFKRASWNKVLGIMANLPGLVPSAIAFRNFHLLHHRYQGELGWDSDLPGPREANFVRNNPLLKALWLLFFPLVRVFLRPLRVKKVLLIELWSVLNFFASVGAASAVLYYWGYASFFYLVFSLIAASGLHPLGARWIQEHYTLNSKQETFSYYGPMNKLSFNVGFHNEHHDFMMIPWSRLPEIKKIAPEYYDKLDHHTSWARLFLNFILNPKFSLFCRIVRPDHDGKNEKQMTSKDTQTIINEAREKVYNLTN